MDSDWSLLERRAALAIAAAFDEPEFVPAKWIKPEPVVQDGKTVHMLGWPEYDPSIDEFFAAIWSGGSDPYTGEPWQAFYGAFFDDPSRFASSSAEEIRRFFMILKRQERFGDGVIEGAFRKGLIRAALDRLRELTPSR